MNNGSIYAQGMGMVKMKPGAKEERINFKGKTLELMECLTEAGALTKSAAATALRCSRHKVGKAGKALWRSGAINAYNVFSRDVSGVTTQFQLWTARSGQPPADAKEACHLAILGLFYSHAKIEMPGFGWRLIRRSGRPVMAEVSFTNKDGEMVKWLIDAPRRGDVPAPEADLIICPTLEDAEQKTPAGKRYAWDLAIMSARPDELRNAVKLKRFRK